ncbi:FliH/SctL family protein [Candidatus Solirubrobacter pratensis]|uniref:FliH/SctL family protein n=1 Tax=Candidatus Solirubrobacter pratensis TaxID=1298857 RepID=UPI00041AEFEB|nr:FliH/SctL family protein [Candidatus Solirubrobacter pratensis]
MSAVEFDFETLETPAAPVAAEDAADAVMETLAQARADAEQLREAAWAEGYAAGRAEAMSALEPALAALADAVAGIKAEQVAATERLERSAVELGLALAEKVLAGVLAVEPERVVESVRGALRGLVERERITVLVNPADLELVAGAMEELRASLGGIEHVVVEAERRVARGGCVVRTQDGDVDAGVDTKLARAREVIEQELGRAA